MSLLLFLCLTFYYEKFQPLTPIIRLQLVLILGPCCFIFPASPTLDYFETDCRHPIVSLEWVAFDSDSGSHFPSWHWHSLSGLNRIYKEADSIQELTLWERSSYFLWIVSSSFSCLSNARYLQSSYVLICLEIPIASSGLAILYCLVCALSKRHWREERIISPGVGLERS